MKIFNKFLSVIFSILVKTGNLDPPSGTVMFVSVLIGLNLTGFVYILIIVFNIDNNITKDIRYIIAFIICVLCYFFINNKFKKSENEIVNFKASVKEYIYAFIFVFFLVGSFILMANFTRSRF